MFGSASSRKYDHCKGNISFVDDTARIDCSSCDGKADPGDPNCFRGISLRMPPGFSGEVILKKKLEKGFKGPLIEAMATYADILSILDRMAEEKGTTRRLFSGVVDRIRKEFADDPSFIVKNADRTRKDLRKGGYGLDTIDAFDDLVERTSLMIRKLESSLE